MSNSLKNDQPFVYVNIFSLHNCLNRKHFKFECPLCDKKLHTMWSWEIHMANQHLVKRKKFESIEEINIHKMNKHSGKKMPKQETLPLGFSLFI